MLDDILELMKAMSRHGVSEVRWTSDRGKVVLKSSVTGAAAPAAQRADAESDDPMASVDWSEIIESPVVGTYYAQAAPNEPPFVSLGSRVEKGQTICIIEAMKLLNEIVAPHSGIVTEIYAEDGQKVEYGQMMMRIKPLEGEK
ncbi:MAG TPA: acetyl-CoA carboxylase biotin carboxyl carrier protein [Clostridiaceae bacterium]|nr:acetyl-CoA carboxylase biotin carboxyl carrier protein [Clostridiaceae bacterium]